MSRAAQASVTAPASLAAGRTMARSPCASAVLMAPTAAETMEQVSDDARLYRCLKLTVPRPRVPLLLLQRNLKQGQEMMEVLQLLVRKVTWVLYKHCCSICKSNLLSDI